MSVCLCVQTLLWKSFGENSSSLIRERERERKGRGEQKASPQLFPPFLGLSSEHEMPGAAGLTHEVPTMAEPQEGKILGPYERGGAAQPTRASLDFLGQTMILIIKRIFKKGFLFLLNPEN